VSPSVTSMIEARARRGREASLDGNIGDPGEKGD
jgi:hypothetical protein